MNITQGLQKRFISVGIPLLMILALAFVAKSTLFNQNQEVLSLGITFDLLLTIPIIYFLLIRKTSIPIITVVPVFILGMLMATILLPEKNQRFLQLAKIWILPVVEVVVLIFLFYKIQKIIKRVKKNENQNFDFFTTLKTVSFEMLPGAAAALFATEVAVFYYGFIYWKKVLPKKNEFTYHKNSGTITLLIAIIFIIPVEASIIHILLSKWNYLAAWIMTGFSVYAAVQLFGFLKSITGRPIIITSRKLYLRYGILAEVTIDIEDIKFVDVSPKSIEFNNMTRKLSPLGDLESYNVIVSLKKEYFMTSLYGLRKRFKTLALFVDDKNEFKAQLENPVVLDYSV